MPDSVANRISLRHLRLVAAVDEYRQLSDAAQALSMTQPAASRSLAELETILGTALFERRTRGMAPTAAGEALARRARNMLTELGEAAEEIGALREGRGGTVRIGAVTGGAVGYAVPAIRQMKAAVPRAEVLLDTGTSAELIRGLMAQDFDFVLARIPPGTDASRFRLTQARGEQIRVIARDRHPAAGAGLVSLRDLYGFEWVMQGRGAPIRNAIELVLLDLGYGLPQDVTVTSSLLVMMALLSEADTICPVSREVADLLTRAGPAGGIVEVPIREEIEVVPYSLITLGHRALTPLAQLCQGILSELLRG